MISGESNNSLEPQYSIILIEDDDLQAALLQELLSGKENGRYKTDRAARLDEGLKMIRSKTWASLVPRLPSIRVPMRKK